MSAFGSTSLGTSAFAAGGSVTVNVTLSESLALVGSIETSFAVQRALEQLVFSGSALTQTVQLATITEALGLSDQVRLVFEEILTASLALTGTGTNTTGAIVAIVDSLVLTGTAPTTVAAMQLVTEALALNAALTRVYDETITNPLVFAATLDGLHLAYATLVAEAVFSATASTTVGVTVLANESVLFDAAATPAQILQIALREQLDFAVSFTIGNDPYFGLSINARTRGVAEHTNVAVNSLAVFNGTVYGADAAGLYTMEGNTDAGTSIAWHVRTGMSRLGMGKETHMDAAYLGYTASGQAVLKCIVTEPRTGGHKKVEYWYTLDATGGAPREARIKVGRGMRSVYWAFELAGVADSRIALDVIELHPLVTTRRI